MDTLGVMLGFNTDTQGRFQVDNFVAGYNSNISGNFTIGSGGDGGMY